MLIRSWQIPEASTSKLPAAAPVPKAAPLVVASGFDWEGNEKVAAVVQEEDSDEEEETIAVAGSKLSADVAAKPVDLSGAPTTVADLSDYYSDRQILHISGFSTSLSSSDCHRPTRLVRSVSVRSRAFTTERSSRSSTFGSLCSISKTRTVTTSRSMSCSRRQRNQMMSRLFTFVSLTSTSDRASSR